jgi:hypothetical protein
MRLAIVVSVLLGGWLAAQQRPAPPTPAEDRLGDLVQAYLWPASDANFGAAETALRADSSLKTMTRERFHDVEEAMRRGRRTYPPAPARVDGRYRIVELSVDVPAGPAVPVLVQLPSPTTREPSGR